MDGDSHSGWGLTSSLAAIPPTEAGGHQLGTPGIDIIKACRSALISKMGGPVAWTLLALFIPFAFLLFYPLVAVVVYRVQEFINQAIEARLAPA